MSAPGAAPRQASGEPLSAEWADRDVGVYLNRCQIDTPSDLVEATWRHVHAMRPSIGHVVDFGAGDGRFARGGRYRSYVGYEIDRRRIADAVLPPGARLEHRCAFAAGVADADLCIGNPPFVRNQDLPDGWREQVSARLAARSGLHLSGLANAWQHFFLLALLSVHDEGLCALVIPYEWVSRPSVAILRDHIRDRGWHVDVHRLREHSFETVLTTASITLVDKSRRDGVWRFLDTDAAGIDTPMPSTSGGERGHVGYTRVAIAGRARAIRGLSPGTQRVLVLTEGERARLGLRPHRDVRRCVTSLRHLPADAEVLDEAGFDRNFRHAGAKCWLVDPAAADASGPLRTYLDSVSPADYATATCLERDVWWRFAMPGTPSALLATCFKGGTPKAVANRAGAVAVGGVAGIHGATAKWTEGFLGHLRSIDLRTRIVPHAKGLMKLEPGQINTLIAEYAAADGHG